MNAKHTFRIKRIYEKPSADDGQRFLVDRLWPRGVQKKAVAKGAWLRDVAPSPELRKWFNHEADKWTEFQRRYRAELKANPDAWEPLLAAVKKSDVTLLYSAKDTEHNQAVVLKGFLDRLT